MSYVGALLLRWDELVRWSTAIILSVRWIKIVALNCTRRKCCRKSLSLIFHLPSSALNCRHFLNYYSWPTCPGPVLCSVWLVYAFRSSWPDLPGGRIRCINGPKAYIQCAISVRSTSMKCHRNFQKTVMNSLPKQYRLKISIYIWRAKT